MSEYGIGVAYTTLLTHVCASVLSDTNSSTGKRTCNKKSGKGQRGVKIHVGIHFLGARHACYSGCSARESFWLNILIASVSCLQSVVSAPPVFLKYLLFEC